MIEKLRKNPLGTALIVSVVYGIIIFGPALLGMGGEG